MVVKEVTFGAWCLFDTRRNFKCAAFRVDIPFTMFEMETPPPQQGSFIDKPPGDLAAWLECFDPEHLPVQRNTALAIEELRANEDQVDAHLLAEPLSHDPLMTLKLMAHLARVRSGRGGTDPETVTAALVMLGITPFFRSFGLQRTVEEHLAEHPGALDGFSQVLRRAHRAARFALGFAVQRMDHDAAVIHEAALLHDFVELLMWLKAPTLASEVVSRQRSDPSLRSSVAQFDVYNVRLADLQHALMVRWHLPQLLIDISDDKLECTSSQARNVVLAVRLARHTADGWENPALGDDIRDTAELLNMGWEPTLALLHDLDEE